MSKLRKVDDAIKETLIAQDREKDAKKKKSMDKVLAKLRDLRRGLVK